MIHEPAISSLVVKTDSEYHCPTPGINFLLMKLPRSGGDGSRVWVPATQGVITLGPALPTATVGRWGVASKTDLSESLLSLKNKYIFK